MNNDELMFQDDELVFNEEEQETSQSDGKWKLLIVDDEQEVHNITKLVLGDFSFMGKSLEFISAYSGAEAKEIIAKILILQ
jgi:hypothetical protein